MNTEHGDLCPHSHKKERTVFELSGYKSRFLSYLGSLNIIGLEKVFTSFCNCLRDCVLPSEARHWARTALCFRWRIVGEKIMVTLLLL